MTESKLDYKQREKTSGADESLSVVEGKRFVVKAQNNLVFSAINGDELQLQVTARYPWLSMVQLLGREHQQRELRAQEV